jgi:hypothetical protein
MTHSLSLRPRAMAELAAARDHYAKLGAGDAFLAEIESVFEAMRAMPLRFPIVYETVHRALLKRYPLAVFFRIRPMRAWRWWHDLPASGDHQFRRGISRIAGFRSAQGRN